MTIPYIPETTSLDQRAIEQESPQTHPYQLKANRAPQYRCGTCGSRNCSCLNLVEEEEPDQRFARGGDDLLQQTWRATHHPQHKIVAIQAKNMSHQWFIK